MHQRPATARESALDHQRVPRSEEHLGDRRRIGQLDRIGDRQRLTLVGHDQFGVAGARLDAHHTVADLPERDPLADRRHGAGVLEPEDLVLAGDRVAVTTHPLQRVGPVAGAVRHAHEDLVGAWNRVGNLGDGEDLGPSVLGDDDSSHDLSVVGSRAWHNSQPLRATRCRAAGWRPGYRRR